jgi:hypothetical protein
MAKIEQSNIRRIEQSNIIYKKEWREYLTVSRRVASQGESGAGGCPPLDAQVGSCRKPANDYWTLK